ncbi:MAG: hypothetical protein WBD12_03570, partial [Candidatus Omnitrophota bacterium]
GNKRYEYDNVKLPGSDIGRIIRITKEDGRTEDVRYYGNTGRISGKTYKDAAGNTILVTTYGYRGDDIYEFNGLIEDVRPGHCMVYEVDWEVLGVRDGVTVDEKTGDIIALGKEVDFADFIGRDLKNLIYTKEVDITSLNKDQFYSVLNWMKTIQNVPVEKRPLLMQQAESMKKLILEQFIKTQSTPKEDFSKHTFDFSTEQEGDFIGTVLYWGGLHGKEDFDFEAFQEAFAQVSQDPGIKEYIRISSEWEYWTPERKAYVFSKFVSQFAVKVTDPDVLAPVTPEIKENIRAQIREKRGERIDKVIDEMEYNILLWRLRKVIKDIAVYSGVAFFLFMSLFYLLGKRRPWKVEEGKPEPETYPVPKVFMPQIMLLEGHQMVNDQIERLRKQLKYRELPEEEKALIAGALAESKDKLEAAASGDILPTFEAEDFKVFIYDTKTPAFVTGQTTHIGISTKSIHITKEEYERLRAMAGSDEEANRFLAARFAHEMYEVRGLVTYFMQNAGDAEGNIRDWIRETLRTRAGPDGEEEYVSPDEAYALILNALQLHNEALGLEHLMLPEGRVKDNLLIEMDMAVRYARPLEADRSRIPVISDINIAADLNAPSEEPEEVPAATPPSGPVAPIIVPAVPGGYDFEAAVERMKRVEKGVEDAFWKAHRELEPVYYKAKGSKVVPEQLTKWYSIPMVLGGTALITQNIIQLLDTGLLMGWGWSVWATGILFIATGLYTSRKLIQENLRRKPNRLERQEAALDVIEPALNEAIESLERLMTEGGDGFTPDDWKRMLKFDTPSRFAHPDDVIAQETISVNLYDYLVYCREWVQFLQEPANKKGDYLMYSRFHTPKKDVQRNLPTFYLTGKHFTSVYRNNDYNSFVDLMPGGHEPVPDNVPYNGPKFYNTTMGVNPVHPMPLTNVTMFTFRAIDRINYVHEYYNRTGDLNRALQLDDVERSYRMRGFVEQAKGYGGVGPARSSYAKGKERHGFRLKALVVAFVTLGLAAFVLRILISRVIPIPEVPELNATLSIFITFLAAMTGYMINVMIEKVTLFGNSFLSRAGDESIIDSDLGKFVPTLMMFQALERILGDEQLRATVNTALRRLTRRGALTQEEADDVLTALSDKAYADIPQLVQEEMMARMSKEYSGTRGRWKILKGEFPSTWPINQLRLEYPIPEVVYLMNKTDRQTLVSVVLADERLSARLTEEQRTQLAANPEWGRERRLNGDILEKFTIDDVDYMLEKYNDKLLAKFILMDTTFG